MTTDELIAALNRQTAEARRLSEEYAAERREREERYQRGDEARPGAARIKLVWFRGYMDVEPSRTLIRALNMPEAER